jgi:hypothetical protein
MEIETLSTPAADATREEYSRIMFDPTHPMHAGYKVHDPKVEAHINKLYERAYVTPPNKPPEVIVGDGHAIFDSSRDKAPALDLPPVVPNDGLSFTSDITGADRIEHARTEALTTLQREFGAEFTLDVPQDVATIQATLRGAWGIDFDSRYAGAVNVASQLFERDPQLTWEATMLLGDERAMRLADAIRQVVASYRG